MGGTEAQQVGSVRGGVALIVAVVLMVLQARTPTARDCTRNRV